ncbi:phosphoglycerate mutase family protein [Bacillus sp. UNCCL81]|uniref:phosphoglycerate mutase family protein n=1 Tax=Bacillus sp. UNCCL81 TaxID=1502755 RepID=UPI0008ECC7F4|nr:phosphoglycerate mutase family protein [Bacillus sp. UNCCL81]SFD46621.1 Histidine phosphatase superfamily (branch 1) [Bacillus sp. UNCCL81]
MEISLIRHGKSLWTEDKPITCREFKKWIQKYDDNGVFEEETYPLETLKIVANTKVIITSDLIRTIKSAEFLNPDITSKSNPLFRETELPTPMSNLLGLRLKPSIWAVILRCLWFGGYSSNCESLNEAKVRAAKASNLLKKYAQEHTDIVLVGHGFFNLLIAKELKKTGWKVNKKTSSKHWHINTFSVDD